jgi:hypothetical protein
MKSSQCNAAWRDGGPFEKYFRHTIFYSQSDLSLLLL